MNVSVFSDELDASLQASQQIASVAEEELDNGIIFVRSLNLLAIVFKNDSNELN